jgi:hypothetical protein
MDNVRREVAADGSTHYYVELTDRAEIRDQIEVVRLVRETAQVVLDERPTITELSALLAALREAETGATSVEEAVAGAGLSARWEAWARRHPLKSQVIVGSLVNVFTTLLFNQAPAPDSTPAPTPHVDVQIDVHIEQPPEDQLQRIVEEAVRQRLQELPSDEQPTPGE